MKKTIIALISIVLFTGCSMAMKAEDVVKEYLNNYKSLDSSVMDQIDDMIAKEDLTDKQKNTYKEVLKRQYEDMTYEITSSNYRGDDATVSTKVTIYDYYGVQQDIINYLKENRDKFTKDGEYDEESYIDYKLDKMKNYNQTISYTIDFKLHKKNNKWEMEKLSQTDLEKIHGIYDYSND